MGLGVVICVGSVIFEKAYTFKWLLWGFVEKGMKIRCFGGVGAVLAVDPGLAVETGPDGVGRRQN